jgi:hypothetical protein
LLEGDRAPQRLDDVYPLDEKCMSDEWYYSVGNDSLGPVSFRALEDEITRAPRDRRLVWTKGMEDWADPHAMPAFKHLFADTPPPLPRSVFDLDQVHGGSPRTASSSLQILGVRPWRRYFARMIDVCAFAFLFGIVSMAFPNVSDAGSTTKGASEHWFGWLILGLYIPVEALLLAAFGTTVGKSLYRIKIRPAGSTTYASAFRRSVLVWWRGMGTGFPIAALVTLTNAYSKLKKNGITSWDKDCDYDVSHLAISGLRWTAIASVWVLIAICFILSIAAKAES